MCCADKPLSFTKCAKSSSGRLIKLGPKQYRSGKRVTFGEAKVVATIASKSQEERKAIWYQATEMQEFRYRARNFCKTMRRHGDISCDEKARGLEFRTSPVRQQQQALTVKIVLKAHVHYKNAQDVARISKKCSARATHIAVATGQKDYFTSYFPSLVNTNVMDQLPVPSFPVTNVSFNMKKRLRTR